MISIERERKIRFCLIMVVGILSLVSAVVASEQCLLETEDDLDGLRKILDNSSWPLMQNAQGQNQEWKSIGSFVNNLSHCTVTLVEPPGECAFNPDQPALILTSGHCVDISNQVHRGTPLNATVKFNYFEDTQEQQIVAGVSEIVYAGMNRKDVAVMKLNLTYRELASQGIVPKKISRRKSSGALAHPSIPVMVAPPHFLRKSTCAHGGEAALVEGPYIWPNQMRLSCPGKGGSSGSGLFNEDGEVSGVMNTVNNAIGNPHYACAMNLPCEITKDGTSEPSEVTAYGFDTAFLHNCYTPQCVFVPEARGCDLPTETPVAVALSSPTRDPELRVTDAEFKAIRYKVGPVGKVKCSDPRDYQEGPSSIAQKLKAPKDGVYQVCILGQRQDGKWQSLKNAEARSFIVDRTPPVAVPVRRGDNRIIARSVPAYDHLAFKYQYADNLSECQGKESFRSPNPVESNVGISLVSAKAILCLVTLDKAGNISEVISFPTVQPANPADTAN
jgi:hypothetical protein